jgi:hypothetical protein
MATLTFDTLKFVKRLKGSGFTDEQAEAISEAFQEAQHAGFENLATKDDLRELELRLIKWVFAISAGQAALIVALLRLIR